MEVSKNVVEKIKKEHFIYNLVTMKLAVASEGAN